MKASTFVFSLGVATASGIMVLRYVEFHASADYRQAISSIKQPQFEDSIPVLTKYASRGRESAIYHLALSYTLGQGIARSFERAESVLEDSPCSNYDKGAMKLAIAIDVARVEPSSELVKQWLNSAARDGNRAAVEALARGE